METEAFPSATLGVLSEIKMPHRIVSQHLWGEAEGGSEGPLPLAGHPNLVEAAVVGKQTHSSTAATHFQT